MHTARWMPLLLLVAGTASAAPPRITPTLLVTDGGMTLYVFDKDIPRTGLSTCYQACAAKWPPLLIGADDKPEGDFGIVLRDDGSRQWSYKGKPLYTWIEDTKPGDTRGDGMARIWHIARP